MREQAVSRDELREATLGGLRWVSLARAVAEACALASMVLLAHLIPPAEFGALAVALIVNELAHTVAGEGIGAPLVQRERAARGHLEGAQLLSLACGAACTLATLALASLVAEPLFGDRVAELFRLFSPAFLIAGAAAVPRAMLQRRLDFRTLSVAEIVALLASVTTTVGLAAAGLDAEALVLGTLAGGLMTLLVLGIATRPPPPRWRPREIRELAGFGGLTVASGLAWAGARNVDYAILAARLGTAQVGFYWRAFTLAVEYQRKISNIVVSMALPVFSRAESLEHMRAIRARVVRLNTTTLFPLLALFVAVAPTLIPWMLGERWEPTVAPAQILAVAGMAAVMNTSTGYAVLAAGRPGAMLVFNLVQLVAFGALVYAVAPLGLIAVAAAVAGFRVAVLVASYRLLLARHLGVPTRTLLADVAPAAAGSAAVLCVTLPLASSLEAAGAPPPAVVAATAATAAAVYTGVVRLGFPAAWDDLRLVASRLVGGLRRPRRAILLTALALPLTLAPGAGAQTATHELRLSTAPDRSASRPLEGAQVSGDMYVFVAPESGLSEVSFYIDDRQRVGAPHQVERGAPWDMGGTAADRTAQPFNSTLLGNGTHTVTAVLKSTSGTTSAITSTFTVTNELRLWLSASSNRSGAVALDGRTVAGNAYVFTGSEPGIAKVRFFLDDPGMTGAPRRTDLTKPFDFAGEGTLGVAPPYDTRQLANGEHTITAAVDWLDGTTTPITSRFTVNNPVQTEYSLAVSASHDRSAPSPLAGATLSRNAYVFLTPEQDVRRVLFYIDDPARSGAPYKTEGGAPYDLAGTNANGTAVPYDTRLLANGQHTVTAAVETVSSGVKVVSSTFTVANGTSACWPLACSEVLVSYPYSLDFAASHGNIPDGAGVGTGFTWVDPPTGRDGYKPENLTMDLAGGRLQVRTTAGLAHTSSNSQDNALGVGLRASDGTSVLRTTLVGPPTGGGAYEQAGLWLGNDQDNYVKLALVSAPGGNQLQFLRETAGAVAAERTSATVAVGGSNVALELRADPAAATVTAVYRIGSGAEQSLGTLAAPPELFSQGSAQVRPEIGTATFGGIFASHRNAATPLTYAFDGFSATTEPATQPPPPKCSPLPCSEILIDLPYELGFGQDHSKVLDGAGVGTGFTTIAKPAGGSGYLPGRLAMDTGAGKLKVTTTAGLFHQADNAQDNALGVGIDAASQTSVVQATLASPPTGSGNYEQAGVWFGNDQDNYLKLAVMSTPAGTQVQHLMEVGGAVAGDQTRSLGSVSGTSVTLTLSANPSTRQVTASYRVGGGASQTLGSFAAPPELFSFDAAGIDPEIGTRSFGGIFASHRRGPAPLTYAFDDFSVTAGAAPPAPPPPDGAISFERTSFPVPNPTSIARGPDGRLYVLELFGKIHALTLDPEGKPISDQVISTLGTRMALGITVDPQSTPSNVILWVSHSSPSLDNGVPNSGAVTRLSGPGFTTRSDVITGLPRAKANHATNSLHFAPDGRLYLAQGGNTGAGAPNTANTEFGTMEEQPLSAALLAADVRNPAFDGSCANTTDIFGPPPCDVTVVSSGLRNTYDFVFHSNGLLYAPDNGLGVTGTFPPSPTPPCLGMGSTTSWTSGGHNPGSQPDGLNLIEPGRYYGHPNPRRNECVFKDGRYQGVPAPAAYRAPIHDLGANKSSNGTIEYRSEAFCGRLKGDLLIANYSLGDDLTRVKLSADGRSVASASSLIGGFNDPLPVAQGPEGNIYVGEFGGGKLTTLRPADLGCWRTRQPAPAKVLDAGGAAVGGKLYVVAGKTATAYRSAMDVYDPATDSWSSGPPLPGPAVENPALVAHDGRLYAFGGSTAAFSGAVANAAVFDPVAGAWTALPPMPTARGGAAAQVLGGRIYVVGGMAANGSSLATVEVFDPATGSWSSGPAMGTRRDNPGAAAVDGKLYVFGGRTRNADGSTVNGTLASVEALDPASGGWSARAPMPTGRRTMAVGRLGGRVQLMGGEIRSDGGSFNQNEEYDPAGDSWRALPAMPTGRHGAAAGTIAGVVYVVGGGPTGGSSFTDVNEAFSLP